MDKSESRIMNNIYLILLTIMFWLVVIYPLGWLHNYLSYI